MTTVFIGGSRHISRLNVDVRRRIDRMIAERLPIVIGDANGADQVVQRYLQERNYEASSSSAELHVAGLREDGLPVPEGRGADEAGAEILEVA